MFFKSLQDGSGNFGTETNTKVVKNAAMQKLSEIDDIENYLTTFERVAMAFKWPEDIWSLKLAQYLTGKAQVAFATKKKNNNK